MDVKTAFLNGELDEEIYMQQPEGFVVKGQDHKVCKLVKSLYGLKQALKQWHEKFDNTLLSNGFQINECDKCVYVKQYKNAFFIICLYVDDMLIMRTNMDVINQTKKMLPSSFDMKDMGEADVILGITIQKNSNGYILTQSHYIEKTLKKFRHNDDRPVVTPFDPKVQLKKNKGQNHWDALVRVLQYLKHTMAYGLHYTKYPPVLEGYCDANWISNHNEGKSTSGYVFTLEGVVVSWKSSKQTMNTRSTMEAEFVALDKAAEEAEWLRSFLKGILLWPKLVTAVCTHCDSMAALTRAKNHIYNSKSRHIRRRHNTIKDLLRNGIISIDYVTSKENIAGPLTKGLYREQVIFTSRGSDFRRWQQKMLFYLTSLHVSYVLTDSEPVDQYLVDGENVSTEAQMADYERAASQWNHNEYNFMNDAKPVRSFDQLVLKIRVEEDNRMIEKADANLIEPNANLQAKYRSKTALDLIYGDLCGPISPPTPSGKRYIFLLVDDYSRYMWEYFLNSKDQAFGVFKEFKTRVEKEHGTKIKTFRTDRGGEFTSNEFHKYCRENGIIRQLTAPYSPQQNGVVEMKNRTILSTTRCMMKAIV
ncbi:retrovirus-related pol polyprotein from transposon TNT 1-94 [Tanacetum coccineum]